MVVVAGGVKWLYFVQVVVDCFGCLYVLAFAVIFDCLQMLQFFAKEFDESKVRFRSNCYKTKKRNLYLPRHKNDSAKSAIPPLLVASCSKYLNSVEIGSNDSL